MSELKKQSFPESLRIILILNPRESKGTPLSLPDSFLHVTLTTPYRSTIAITRLAQFIAKQEGLVVPKGQFGSDCEGTKPIFFDIGKPKSETKKALEYCRKCLGDNVTILYDYIGLKDSTKKILKKQGKEEGGPWDCYDVFYFFGCEAEKVVAVTSGFSIMEMITRARTHLAVILVDDDEDYTKIKKHFQKAAREGLVDFVYLGTSNGNDSKDEGDKSHGINSGQIDDELQDTNEGLDDDKSQDKLLCFSYCSIL